MAKKPKRSQSARAARRTDEREQRKLVEAREQLFALAPGGAPSRPIVVPSASVVEPHAASVPCPRCGGPLRVEEHIAETVNGARLRVARVRCRDCGAPRALYFRLEAPVLH